MTWRVLFDFSIVAVALLGIAGCLYGLFKDGCD
jgi:hypothetical protein